MAFEKVNADILFEVVPADTLTAERSPAVLGTVYEPTSVALPPVVVLSESVRPLEFVNARRASVRLVAASESVRLEFVTVGTVYEPVMVCPFSPNDNPLEFANVNALALVLVVPAERLMFDSSPAVDGTV